MGIDVPDVPLVVVSLFIANHVAEFRAQLVGHLRVVGRQENSFPLALELSDGCAEPIRLDIFSILKWSFCFQTSYACTLSVSRM
jgi:hypothetical protein